VLNRVVYIKIVSLGVLFKSNLIYMDTNEQIFWTFFITSMIGLIMGLSRMAYKSKCKDIEICCIKIVRDTETEEKELEFSRTHQSESEKENNV